jgi:hypothetical protein
MRELSSEFKLYKKTEKQNRINEKIKTIEKLKK